MTCTIVNKVEWLWSPTVFFVISPCSTILNLLANRAFSLTWPASMLIYWNKKRFLHKKRVQFPQGCFGTPTWPPFHCFGTPLWPPWRHVKTLCRNMALIYSATICNKKQRIACARSWSFQNNLQHRCFHLWCLRAFITSLLNCACTSDLCFGAITNFNFFAEKKN